MKHELVEVDGTRFNIFPPLNSGGPIEAYIGGNALVYGEAHFRR